MIGFLEGLIFDVSDDSLILKTNGIGYEISVTQQTLADAHVLMGQTMPIWIYSHIREDAFQLFGFLTKPEKEFFTQLLKVNGIGPKSALTVMSGARVSQIQSWIEQGDAKALSALPKIGKKTAEQIVLTLKGKLVLIDDQIKIPRKSETHRQISSALVNLGFKSQLVEEFILTVDQKSTMEDGIRLGLQKLARQL